MDPVRHLPIEVCIKIFSYIKADDLLTVQYTSRLWNNFISSYEMLWKVMSLIHCPRKLVLQDRLEGYSWKEVFHQTYGPKGVKRLWLSGEFSHTEVSDRTSPWHICPMDVNTWEEIFQAELDR